MPMFHLLFMATDYAYLIYASQVVGRRVPTRDSKVLIAVVRVASSNPLKKLGFFMIFPFLRSGPGSSRLHWWRTSGPLLSFQWRRGPKRQVPHLPAFPGIWHQNIVVVSSTVQKHRTAEAPVGRFGTTYYIILLQQQRAGCHSWLFDLASTRRTARWSRPSAEQSQGNKTGQAVKSVSPMSIAWMLLHTSFLALLTYLPYYLLTCTYWLVSRHSAK